MGLRLRLNGSQTTSQWVSDYVSMGLRLRLIRVILIWTRDAHVAAEHPGTYYDAFVQSGGAIDVRSHCSSFLLIVVFILQRIIMEIPPNQTIIINNLNETVEKDGKLKTKPFPSHQNALKQN